MKFPPPIRPAIRSRHGFLQIDLAMGLVLFSLAVMPLGYSFARERQVLQMEYQRSVADQIVDGEMEILVDGAARNYSDGSQIYPVHSRAFNVLPPGHFQLTKTGNHLRLEWMPDTRHGIGSIVREATLP